MKKIITSLILVIFLFGNLSFVLAETYLDDSSYNFFNDIGYKLQKMGLFTAAGQSRSCSTYADETIIKTDSSVKTYSYSDLVSGPGCDGYSLIDVFDSSYNFLKEYRSESIFSGTSNLFQVSSPRIIEVYCCPYKACTSDSGCSSSPASNYGTTCNTNYGSCYGTAPTHKTKVYKCISGNWVQQSSASYGQSHFCSDSTKKDYISQTGAEGCYSSAPDGWCTAVIEECTNGQQKCVGSGTSSNEFVVCSDGKWGTAGGIGSANCLSGNICTPGEISGSVCHSSGTSCDGDLKCDSGETTTNCPTDCCVANDETCNFQTLDYYKCISGNWVSQGHVVGKCGYTPGTGDIRMESGKSWSTSSSIVGKQVTFKIPLKNYGTKEETINLEAGFYSKTYAQNVAQLYSTVPLFSVVDIVSCNPYEEFVISKKVTLSPGETQTVEIKVDAEKGFSTYSVGTHNLNTESLIAFFGLYKQCLGGYINEAGTTGKGVMFDYKEFSTNCPFLLNINIFCGTENIGTCKLSTLKIDKECSIPLTSGIICEANGDTNCDGIVSRDELGVFITKWINNEVTREALGNVIQLWAKQ